MNTTPYTTDQEQFWAGEFGNEYSERNQGDHWVASNQAMFASILRHTRNVHSILELGSNIGLNLRALRGFLPKASLSSIEINEKAVARLRAWGEMKEIFHQSLLTFSPTSTYDFVFTKGVLIHINPEHLQSVYECLYRASARYVMVAEYYNPTPAEIPYRGHEDRLFKRDFAGEILKKYPDLKLVDYGFVYHADPNFPQDDLTWFLMEKCS